MKNKIIKIFFLSIFVLIYITIIYTFFNKIFLAKSLVINFSVHPFNICSKYPKFWWQFKLIYIFTAVTSSLILGNSFYNKFIINHFSENNAPYSTSSTVSSDLSLEQKKSLSDDRLDLLVGLDESKNKIYIPNQGLFQNILITGTIGTRKNKFFIISFNRTNNCL